MVDWKIVDEHGDDVMTAESIALMAKMQDTSPRLFAQREARLLSSGGGDLVIAVRAEDKENVIRPR